jgi:hypothetical protein
MTEPKSEAKTQIERLVADFGAQDMGTYMDARTDDRGVLRVAVWNTGLNSYQPTEDGLALLAGGKTEKEKSKEKAKAKMGDTPPQQGQPAAPPGFPPAGPRPPTG